MRDLLYQHTGIALAEHKLTMVQSRLAKRLRKLGIPSFDAYLDRLQAGDAEEWTQFINALTTNLTKFFREAHHFDRVVAWAREHRPTGKLRIWSAGCSTGEEPYTIALVLLDAFGPGVGLELLASDLDSNVLATAQRGVYPENRIEGLEARWLKLGFLRGRGAQEGQVRVKPELQRFITFQQKNLLHDAFPPAASLDIIFCRNVMIYFDKPTQRRLVERFRDCLVPGGLLALGHSEALLGNVPGLKNAGGTMYARVVSP
jgi:chemotaxis protein methyltransferase CheR